MSRFTSNTTILHSVATNGVKNSPLTIRDVMTYIDVLGPSFKGRRKNGYFSEVDNNLPKIDKILYSLWYLPLRVFFPVYCGSFFSSQKIMNPFLFSSSRTHVMNTSSHAYDL